jgi:uncharacterized membrane protein YqjE
MSGKGLAVSAAEMVGTHIVESGAKKAIQSLPEEKQKKVRAILLVACAIVLIVSGLVMAKKD